MATPRTDGSSQADGSPRTDRSRWNPLLLLPIAIPLIPPLFNAVEPRLFGIPLFYWLQLAFIVLGVTTTTVVYRATRRNR